MQNTSNMQPKTKSNMGNFKTYLIVATIILVCSCAFLAILMIFFGANDTLLRVLSTLLVMYLVLLCSTKNFTRMENELALVQGLSIAALIANFFWSFLWILIIWGAFGDCDTDAQTIAWKVVGSAAVISAFCTFLSSKVAGINGQPTIIKFFKSLPLVCAAFIGIDLLLLIWIDDMGSDFMWKLIWSEVILVALQGIITNILRKNAWRLGVMNNGVQQNVDNANSSNMNSQGVQNAQQQQPVAQNSQTDSSASGNVVTEKSYEDELREKIEREVRAKIAAEQVEKQKTGSDDKQDHK